MSLQDLPQAQLLAGTANQPVEAAEVIGEISDETALKIVLADVAQAERDLTAKRRPQEWENADNLFRGVVKGQNWPGTDIARSNLSMPVILEAVEKIMPVMFSAFFSDKTPFLLTATGKTTPNAARAKTSLLKWAIKVSDFKEQIRHNLKHWLLYGFCVGKWGWKTSVIKSKKYAKDPSTNIVSSTPEEYEISHPTYENVELRNVVFDATLRTHDCRKGRYGISQHFITADDLADLASDPTYKNVPSREQLAEILSKNSEPPTDSLTATKINTYRDLQAKPEVDAVVANPLDKPLELLEYVCDEYVFTILQRCIVIRNEPNEFDKMNYLSCAFIDVPGSMYGFGIAKLLSGEQLFQTGAVNSWNDNLALQLNPSFQLKKGTGPGTQNVKLSPGKIINESGEMVPLQIPSITQEATGAIEASEGRADRRVGANSADSMPTQALRTSAGVQAFNSSTVDRLQYEIEIFANQIFIPALEAMLDVCKANLQPDDINKILSDEDGKEYQGDIVNEVYNGTCSIDVLSSTKLAARRAAANLVTLLLQMVSAPAVQDSLTAQGKKFNYTELVSEAIELTGWDVDALIVDASPQDIQQAMALKPGAQQAQAQQALMDQKQKDALELIEAQGEARAGVQVVKHILTESGQKELSALPRELEE